MSEEERERVMGDEIFWFLEGWGEERLERTEEYDITRRKQRSKIILQKIYKRQVCLKYLNKNEL